MKENKERGAELAARVVSFMAIIVNNLEGRTSEEAFPCLLTQDLEIFKGWVVLPNVARG